MTRIGLALGGGGARGLAHIRFLELFDELGLRPSRLAGCSAGAIIAALYASGCSAAEIRQIAERRRLEQFGSLRSFWNALRSVALDLARLAPETQRGGLINVDRLLDHLLEPLENREFADLDPPLVVVSTDFWRHEEVVLDDGPVIPAVQASAAFPGLIAPRRQNGRVLVDGGLVNEVPYDHLFDHSDVVVAIRVEGARVGDGEEFPSGMEASLGAIDILQSEAFRRKVEHRPPDVLIEARIENVEMLEFTKAADVLDQCQSSVDELRAELDRLGLVGGESRH